MNTLLLISSGKYHSYFILLTTLGGDPETPQRVGGGSSPSVLEVLWTPVLQPFPWVSHQGAKRILALLPTLSHGRDFSGKFKLEPADF